jgi:hypothetical protein
MEAYEQAVSIAKEQSYWRDHPNKKRKQQKIALVKTLGCHWRSDAPEEDVELNACVVHDTKKDEYSVFVTTNLSRTTRQIVMTYELKA